MPTGERSLELVIKRGTLFILTFLLHCSKKKETELSLAQNVARLDSLLQEKNSLEVNNSQLEDNIRELK